MLDGQSFTFFLSSLIIDDLTFHTKISCVLSFQPSKVKIRVIRTARIITFICDKMQHNIRMKTIINHAVYLWLFFIRRDTPLEW